MKHTLSTLQQRLNHHHTLVTALILTPLLLPAVQSALTLLPAVQHVVINQLPAVQ